MLKTCATSGINIVMMPIARFSFTLRAVFWRQDEAWCGAGLELAVASSESSLDAAVSALLGQAHKIAEASLVAGDFPGRPLAQVPDDVRGRWERLVASQDGVSLSLSQVFANSDGFTEVAVELDVHTQLPMAQSPETIEPLEVVLFEEDGWWIAQCLSVDIGAESYSKEAAMSAFEQVVIGQLLVDAALGQPSFASLGPAPEKFRAMFDLGVEQPRSAERCRDDIPSRFRVASAA